MALARLRTPQKIAVLHYSPIHATVAGEPPEIIAFLGSSRLEEPIDRYRCTRGLPRPRASRLARRTDEGERAGLQRGHAAARRELPDRRRSASSKCRSASRRWPEVAIQFAHATRRISGRPDARPSSSSGIATAAGSRAQLFTIPTAEAYYDRPIPLRNPIVFYEGHIPAFAVNTLIKLALKRDGNRRRISRRCSRAASIRRTKRRRRRRPTSGRRATTCRRTAAMRMI